MNFIQSQSNFQEALAAERAILFISFDWSEQAARSQEVVEQWERESASQPDGIKCEIHFLTPDDHPYTWKWIGKHLGVAEPTENGACPVLWLRKGSVVGRVQNAASLETKTLARITHECFVAGKTLTSEAAISLHAESRPFDAELLKILCCPETHQPLTLATPTMVEKLNKDIAA